MGPAQHQTATSGTHLQRGLPEATAEPRALLCGPELGQGRAGDAVTPAVWDWWARMGNSRGTSTEIMKPSLCNVCILEGFAGGSTRLDAPVPARGNAPRHE